MVLGRTDAEDPANAEVVRSAVVRLPGRRIADAPAVGAEGFGHLVGAAGRLARRGGRRRVVGRRDGADRPDGRPPRRRAHGGPRDDRALAVIPHFGNENAEKVHRSVALAAPGVPVVGVPERTALVREPDGRWRQSGAGEVEVFVNGHAGRDGGASLRWAP